MTTLEQARAILASRRTELLALPYVQGVVLTVYEGENAILVLMNRRLLPGEAVLPTWLDGVRLITRVVGSMKAM